MILAVDDVIALFDQTFYRTYNTRLVTGSDEPLYLPPGSGAPYGQIIFAHGYVTSALHEVAHWCVAGERRRTLEDYGYWYAPDGRSPEQQKEFESVEVRPQALEWLFSLAAGVRFNFSADNLALGVGASEQFKTAVFLQACDFLEHGLPLRPKQWVSALVQASGQCLPDAETLAYDYQSRLI